MQKEKLTILIPFKNRYENLKVFIPYFHNFMKNNFPNILYEIVIIEQGNDKPFNKGILFNAGFLLTHKNTDYYALHDVDQIPISANYSYNDKPYHLCVNALEQSTSGLLMNPYKDSGYPQRGGSIIINKESYIKANGHSNNYWGWGGIDDDFSSRLNFCNIGLYRYNNNNGYFVTLNATTKRFNEDDNYLHNREYIKKVINREIDYEREGLNSTKFEITNTIINDDYTLYTIDFDDNIIKDDKENGISIVMAYHNRREQLLRTLSSILLTKYDLNKLQIIIVDDCSNSENMLDDIVNLYPSLNIKLIKINVNDKKWVCSCIPFNIGFNDIKYNKVIIQNPESYHNGDILSDVNRRLTDDNYLTYSCYSLSESEYCNNDYNNIQYTDIKPKYACSSGWYNHSKYNPKYYHFLSSITTKNLFKINGFDEDYKDGIGFDDNEILHRIKLLGLGIEIVDQPFIFHQWHESIYHYNDNMSEDNKNNKITQFKINENIYINKTLKLEDYKIINNKYLNK